MSGAAVQKLTDVLLNDRRVPWIVAALYLVVGSIFIVTDYTLNDEGLFTFMMSDYTWYAFAPMLFFQKAKPVLSVFYLPWVHAGLTPFLIAHLIVAALAIPLAAAVARGVGITAANVASLVIVTSTVVFLGGSAGISNTDGLTVALVSLYLMTRNRPFLAGLALGLLPWMRHELMLFWIVLVGYSLFVQRSPRLLLGGLVFPAVYGLSGALYHHDLFWLLHYPPSTVEPPGPTAHNPAMPLFWTRVTFRNLLPNAFAVSTLLPLMLFAPRRVLTSLERALLGYCSLWLLLSIALPTFQIANFGFVPRYIVPVLPGVAILSARIIQTWRTGTQPGLVPLVMAVLLTLSLGGEHAEMRATVLLAGALLLALAWWVRNRSTAATAFVLGIAVAGPALGYPAQLTRPALAGYLPDTRQWIETHRDAIKGPLYTNSVLLGPYLQRESGLHDLDIRYILQIDQMEDMQVMSNQQNGQRGEIRRVLSERGVPGASFVWADVLRPQDIAAGSLFLFRPGDERVKLTLPGSVWNPHLQATAEAGVHVFRFAP